MSTIYIQRKSAVKSETISGAITDTTNVTNKKTNTYSARVIDMLMNIATPVGSGMDYYGTEAPLNYMFADGRELSRTEYAELFKIIGTTYGAGDGNTTFNLPDKRERVTMMTNYPKLDLLDMETKTLSDGSKWAKIYSHNSRGGTVVFNSVDEVKNVQTTDKYSRLYLLDDDRFKTSGRFEFMLCYPDNTTNYNRWIQNNSPCNEYVPIGSKNKAEGFIAVTSTWTNEWGGLTRLYEDPNTTVNAYVTSCVGSTNWWYAIGPFVAYEGGIPGFHDGTNTIVTGRTELWVRYDNLKYSGRQLGYSEIKCTPTGTVGGTAITKAQLPSYDLYNASHTHTQNAHQHQNIFNNESGRYVGINTNGSTANSIILQYSTGNNMAHKIVTTWATATNQSTTIKVSSGGSGQTHTHSFTGSSFNIYPYQPSLVCNYIIKVSSENQSIDELLTEALERSY